MLQSVPVLSFGVIFVAEFGGGGAAADGDVAFSAPLPAAVPI